MTTAQLGESMHSVITQVSPLVKVGSSPEMPVLEMNINGVPVQITIKITPKGMPWLERNEVSIHHPGGAKFSILK